MQLRQPLAQLGHLLEQLGIGGERDPREVEPQELGVLLSVGRGVQDRVHVMEDLLRSGLPPMSLGQSGDEIWVQVRPAFWWLVAGEQTASVTIWKKIEWEDETVV